MAVDWSEDPGGVPTHVGDTRRPWSDIEDRHRLRAATAVYPLLESAIRKSYGRTNADHLCDGPFIRGFLESGRRESAGDPPRGLFGRTTIHRRRGKSLDRISLPSADGFQRVRGPGGRIDHDLRGEARRLGIAPEKWVYLHGCADGHDHWHVSQRIDLHSLAAIRWGAKRSLEMAGKTVADMQFFDLYSCFPAAVDIGRREVGIAEDDPRGLTVTGGLPFFGGPGNNYVTHSIAAMMRRVRAVPGSHGLVSAIGNYVTKHSFGIYSTIPTAGRWQRESPSVLQRELDALPTAPLVEHASGPAKIEAYTILHNKSGPEFSVLFGRLEENGARFVANTPADPAVLADLQNRDSLGLPGTVHDQSGQNIFVPSG